MKLLASKRLLSRNLRRAVLSYRHHQQLPKYQALLSELLSGKLSSPVYSEGALRNRVADLASSRRPLGRPPRVVAFGAHHWERCGFWQSLGTLSHLAVYDYSLQVKKAEGRHGVFGMRRTLGRDFLDFIEQQERAGTVQVAFFYADSQFIATDLLVALAAKGIWTVLMGVDDKHRFQEQHVGNVTTGQRTIAPRFDLYWTSWKAGADLFLNIGANPWYAPLGADPNFYHPVQGSRSTDVVFVGQRYGRREKLISYLRDLNFSVKAFGQGWPEGTISHDRTIELYSKSMAVLGVGDVGALPEVKHVKGRDFEVPMCGGLYLTTFNPELTDFLKIGKEILCYSSLEECAELLHWVRRHPQQANDVRQAGLRRSLRDHTWGARFSEVFSILSGLPAKDPGTIELQSSGATACRG
jgi:spore maturation protein CgeB